MRTRNRGQRRSIVSSLGLGPKQSRNKSVTSLRLTQSKGSHATTHCLQNQLKTRLSSQASRTRVANNVGRPRIRKRGSRGQHGTSRSVYSARVDPKHSNLACDSLSQSAYSTRTRNADEDSLMTSNDSALKTRGCNTKGDKSKYDVSSSDKPLRRGARRGRPSFVRGLSRALFCDGVHSINKPSDFLDTEDRVSVFKLDSSETLTVECVDLKDTSNPIKTEEAGNQFPMDYYIKKEGDNVTNYTSPVPAKRRRGRPLKSYSAAVPKLSAPMKSESKEVFFGEMLGSTSRDSCHVYSDPTKKSDVPGFNLVRVSCTSSPVSLHFGATDDVLQEVLNEVNVLGFVKLPVKRLRKGRQKPQTASGEMDENQLVMNFDSTSVAQIFDGICSESKLNDELATKDLFLAMNGLLRPGVCEVWRRRREDRSKQLSRNLMGRLRPNPRPRRYSDMISQSNHHCHVDGLLSLDSIHNSDKILHQSTRPSTVSAARLTAAKKLIRAKSHVQGSVQIAPIRSHNSGFVDELCQRSSHLDPRKSRAGHRSSKISISMSSQNSRHPDVSHHIDWKFCYVSSNKQNEVPSISNNIQRRRRQTNFTAKGRIESIDDVSSTRSPDSSPHRLEGDNSKECDDFRTQELTNYSHPKSDNAIHLRTCSNDGVDMLGVKYDASVKLMNVRRLERRRKRRRAITFQRKRPSERFLTSRKEGKRYSCKTYSRDDSPASSSTSNSGIVDAYGRSFRQARWYHRPAKDIPSDQTESSYRFHNCLEFRPRKLERSLSSPRIRAGSKLGNRRVGLSEASHVHGSRHRIPRRPDKMCQLTLLDRLVLGLNCSVSQNDDEIHIKQLHAEELNILTQRMSRTGFFIQSLALRQNANNDAEYNIVLTFSSENDASTRRTRRSNSLLRSKLDSHEKPLSYRSSTGNQNCSRRISCLASRHACSSRPHYSSRCHHFRDLNDSPLFDGYQSDSGLFMHPASSCIRDCHSDSEGLRLHRHNYFRKLSINRKVKPHVLRSSEKISHTYSALESFDKVRLRHSQSCSSSGPTKMETPRSCMQFESIHATSSTEAHKRSAVSYRIGSMKEDEQVSATSEESSTVHMNSASNPSHGISKRESSNFVTGSVQSLPYRRHSPRKVIRKVYTGSLTVPKILNRKRISAVITNPLGSSNVSISIASTNSLTSALVSSSTGSTVSCTTPNNSGLSSSASAVLFHDAQMPAYSAANHFRRLQATTTLGVVQNHTTNLEQSKVNGPTLSVIPSALSDPRSNTKSKIQDSDVTLSKQDSSIPLEADMPIDCTDHENLHADYSSKSVTSELIPDGNFGEHNLSTVTAKSVSDSTPETPQFEMESNDPPTNTVSGELHMKVDTESIAVSGDVCSENNVPYGVVSTSSCHVPTVSNFVNDDEITSVIDDSHTPATSLSASQLLKLKRLQDETSRPVSRRDSRSPHRSSHTSLQVQSPGNPVTTRSQNQSQQPEPETGYTQCLQPSQFPQPEQSLQYNQPSMVQNTPGLNSDLRSFSVHLNQELSNRNNPKLEIDDKDDDEDDDMEDFELKNITKVFEPPNVTSFQPTSLPTHKLTSSRFFDNIPSSVTTLQTTISTEPQSFPSANSHHPTFMRTPRASWPIGRPTLNPAYASCSRLQSQCYNPVVPPAVRCFLDSDQNAGSRNIGENFTAPQVPSVVDNVSDQLLVAGKPFVSSSSSAILCGSSGIPAQSSTNTTVCSGPLKRTVVHKYHSFRKILPKSDRPVMLPTAPGYSISPFGANTIGLGRFSVPNSSFSIYRPGGFTANTVLPCEVSTDGTYVMDLGASNITDDGSTISVRHSLCGTSVALTSSNSPVLATNPASQLLKSLLECDDSRTNTVITTVTTTSNLSFTAPTIISTPNSTSGSSTPLWNQPAHQSRGTWQLGKRAVSSSTHRSPSDNSSPKLSHSCFPTSGNSTQSHSPPTSSDPPPILPPTLRLTPGSTSRLQQLQQHYQRQQEAQRRFEQDSLNKLGVADSV